VNKWLRNIKEVYVKHRPELDAIEDKVKLIADDESLYRILFGKEKLNRNY
jgi:hypothetical protein